MQIRVSEPRRNGRSRAHRKPGLSRTVVVNTHNIVATRTKVAVRRCYLNHLCMSSVTAPCVCLSIHPAITSTLWTYASLRKTHTACSWYFYATHIHSYSTSCCGDGKRYFTSIIVLLEHIVSKGFLGYFAIQVGSCGKIFGSPAFNCVRSTCNRKSKII